MSKIDIKAKRIQAEKERLIKKYGDGAAAIGNDPSKRLIVPSPSLALDYTLGTGGFVRGRAVEIFGPPEIGKTSALGYGTIRNAQAMNLTCGIIAMEPDFEEDWVEAHGVDTSQVLIGRPDHGEDAFEMLHDWVFGGLVDMILFDSIGSVISERETESGANKKAFGASGLITWGLNRVMPRAYKNNILLMLINQQRDKQAQIAGLVDSPGGWALKHQCRQRIHIKPGANKWTTRIDGEELVVGRELVAKIIKNKLAEGTGTTARFNFFNVHTEEHPFGIDVAEDVLNVGKRTGVIEGTSWYYHPSFPDGKLHGKPKVAEFLKDNPKAVEQIRQEVFIHMDKIQAEAIEKRQAALEKAQVERTEDDKDDRE